MKATILFIALLCPILGLAQQAGPLNGTVFTNVSTGGQTWSNVSNSQESDDVYAITGNIPGGVGAYSDFLVATGFNFDLPDGVSILGVQVDIERSDPSQLTSDHIVRLVIGGIIQGDNKSAGQPLPATDGYATYGGSTDQWGQSISFKDVENNNFGVAIAMQRNSAGGTTNPQIDNIEITVYYGYLTLPVTLKYFTATQSNETVKLEWKAETESGISRYDIERSSNGTQFTSLLSVAARNQDGSEYANVDYRPLSGQAFYRLKIVELNGSTRYSPVVSVTNLQNGPRISPSPWTKGQELTISNPRNERLTVRFYGGNGELIAETNVQSGSVDSRGLSNANRLVYYKVFDSAGRKIGEGSILIR